MGFHADQEALRVLSRAINLARLGLATVLGRPLTETEGHAPPAQTVTPPARWSSCLDLKL